MRLKCRVLLGMGFTILLKLKFERRRHKDKVRTTYTFDSWSPPADKLMSFAMPTVWSYSTIAKAYTFHLNVIWIMKYSKQKITQLKWNSFSFVFPRSRSLFFFSIFFKFSFFMWQYVTLEAFRWESILLSPLYWN